MRACVCVSTLPFAAQAFEEDDFGATEGIPTRQGIVDILLEIMVGDRNSFKVSVQIRSVSSRTLYAIVNLGPTGKLFLYSNKQFT